MQDLVLGSLHYPSQVSLLTGWTHHLAYQALLFLVLRAGSAHVFCMAAIMELPTVALAAAFIWPELRSDELFLALFFVTRIAFHAVLAVLYSTPHGITRGTGVGTSYLPIIGLTFAAPLHLMWLSTTLRGYIRRRKMAPNSPLLGPLRAVRPHLVRMASSVSSLPPGAFTLSASMPSLPSPLKLMRADLPGHAITSDRHAYRQQQPPLRRRLEAELAAFLTEWRVRDESDVLKALSPLGQVRMRAGRRGDEVRGMLMRDRRRGREREGLVKGY